MTRACPRLLLAAALSCAAVAVHAAPPMGGTIFMDPDIITSADQTTFTGITYAGTGPRLMYDRRVAAFVTYNAFLFNATYSDFAAAVEVQVNPEFGTPEAALAQADKYARVIGRLPKALRTDVQTVWIHQGVQPFGGGNHNLLIHIGQSVEYETQGILEETFIHEAAHTSLDAAHANAAGWVAAQRADPDFISTYARDNPTREDIAESFLPFLAARHRADRITPGAPTGFRIEAGSASGLANLAVMAVDGATRAVTVSAPPGTYFVRVRAQNACGTGPASNEVVLAVP
ncbi:MAG: hypothetical protein AB7N90_14970 [Vicinamibacterales bacterium]